MNELHPLNPFLVYPSRPLSVALEAIIISRDWVRQRVRSWHTGHDLDTLYDHMDVECGMWNVV